MMYGDGYKSINKSCDGVTFTRYFMIVAISPIDSAEGNPTIVSVFTLVRIVAGAPFASAGFGSTVVSMYKFVRIVALSGCDHEWWWRHSDEVDVLETLYHGRLCLVLEGGRGFEMYWLTCLVAQLNIF